MKNSCKALQVTSWGDTSFTINYERFVTGNTGENACATKADQQFAKFRQAAGKTTSKREPLPVSLWT
jgi:hypothetical protein